MTLSRVLTNDGRENCCLRENLIKRIKEEKSIRALVCFFRILLYFMRPFVKM